MSSSQKGNLFGKRAVQFFSGYAIHSIPTLGKTYSEEFGMDQFQHILHFISMVNFQIPKPFIWLDLPFSDTKL